MLENGNDINQELRERSALAIFCSGIVYPLPVILAMLLPVILQMFLGFDPSSDLNLFEFFQFFFIGYFFAAFFGMFFCISIGYVLHFILRNAHKTRLYHYLLAGAVTGGIPAAVIMVADSPGGLGFGFLFLLSGLSLAGFFWLFYYRSHERQLGRVDGLVSALAIVSFLVPSAALEIQQNNYQTEKTAERAWIGNMPAQKFDQLNGPAPLTVTMLRPENWPEQSENYCWSSYFQPLTKKPFYHLKRYVVWEDIKPIDWDYVEPIPSNFEQDHVYASEHKKHCFWAKSHTYTEPGRYVIKLYTDFDRFTGADQTPDHEFEVIVTEPNLSRLK